MAKVALQFTVKPNNRNRQIRVMVNELDERIAAIIEWFPFLVAEQTLADVVRMAPSDVPGYPDMLELRKINVKGVDSAVGIIAPGYKFASRIKSGDETVTLLFVKAVKRVDRLTGERMVVSEAAGLLAKHSPWTVETLPFEPERSIASIRAIRVNEREVKKIGEMRQKELAMVRQQLRRLGVSRMRTGKERIGRKVTRDIGFEVLRREFGIQTRAKAHWRPALSAARTMHVDAALKKLVRWLTVPSERRWQKNLVLKQEQGSVVSRVRRFQQAVS